MKNSDYIEIIKALLEDRREYKYKIREIKDELSDLALNFKGSLQDALEIGLVKYTFPINKRRNK